MTVLDQHQLAAVQAREPRIVCKAGPGAGKTRVLVRRIQRLLLEDCTGHDVLVVTFTNAAAEEIGHRVRHSMGEGLGADDLGVIRVRARGLTVATFHGLALKLLQERDPSVPLRVMDQVDADAALVYAAVKAGAIDTRKAREYLARENGLGDRSRAKLLREPATRGTLKRLHARCGSIDYRGLERAMQEHAAAWAGRWRHILVDEGQDTTLEQQEALHAMAADGCLFVAQDEAQTLYRWRGASPDTWRALTSVGGWAEYTLAANYRSDPGIVAFVNEAAKRAGGVQQQADRDEDTSHRPIASISLTGWVALAKTYPEREAAVLCRTWAQARRAHEALTSAGLDAVLESPRAHAWHRTPEARRLFAMFRVWQDPDDEVAIWRLLAGEVGPLAWENALAQHARSDGSQPLAAVVARVLPAVSQPSVHGLGVLLERLVRFGNNLEPAFATQSAYLPELTPHLRALLDLVPPGGSVLETIDQLRLGETDVDQSDAITVTTVHAAKGREWDHVAVMPIDPEREPCVAYVACSRARFTLRLIVEDD